MQGFIGSWFGMLLLFGWTVALLYHFVGGMRHLAWDAGYRLRSAAGLCQRLGRRDRAPSSLTVVDLGRRP